MTGMMPYYQMPYDVRNIKNGKIPKDFIGMEMWEDEKQFIFREKRQIETDIITGYDPAKTSRVALADSTGFGYVNH